MHRVRVGLIGLAWVFLLVMAATAFLHVAGDGRTTNTSLAAGNDSAPSDPLAELGVAPGNPAPDQPAAASPHKAPAPIR